MKKVLILFPILALLITGCSLTQKAEENNSAEENSSQENILSVNQVAMICNSGNQDRQADNICILGRALNQELSTLFESTPLANNYYIEFDNRKTYTFWLYTKEKPTQSQSTSIVRSIGDKLTKNLPNYSFNFFIFPEHSKKVPGDRLPYDFYYSPSYRHGSVIYPME